MSIDQTKKTTAEDQKQNSFKLVQWKVGAQVGRIN